jgi:hypothetical protein
MKDALASGWAEASFGTITVNHDGRRVPVKASDRAARRGGYRYFGAQGVIDYIDDYLFDGTYLLIAEDGANLVSRAQPIAEIATGQFWVNNHAHVVESVNGISLKFLKHFMNGNSLNGVIRGTAQPKLTQADLNRLCVPVPPTAEQKRITAAIDEQFSRLDVGVAALERVRQNLKRMRAAVLQAAVSGRLVHHDLAEGTGTDFLAMVGQRRGGAKSPAAASADLSVPETWAVASLEAVTDPHRVICYGILMPKVREGGTVPYVEVKDLRAKRLDVAALHRTSAALHNEFSRSQLNTGDVVLAIRGSYDRALVVPAEVAGANVSRDVARIAPLPGIDVSFVAAYLMSPPALQYLRQRARGVAVKGVNISDLRSMPIPVPPQKEQNRIVRELDRINSIIGDLESVLDSERARSMTIRSSILASAFSGNLVPQDPDDEPASALLERIAAECASSNGNNRARTRKPRTPREKAVI